MTNEEAKQKSIRKAWEDAGLIWDEISKYVNEKTGVLLIDNPDLKKTITGYDEFIANNKVSVWFNSGGLHILLISIREIHNNNGWNRIDGPESLPKEPGEYIVIGKDGTIENWGFSLSNHSTTFWLEYFTHWRPIVEIPKPIY